VLFNRNLSGLRFRPRAVEIQQVGQSCLKNVKISPIDIFAWNCFRTAFGQIGRSRGVIVVFLWRSGFE
jgi:hypothetical protein